MTYNPEKHHRRSIRLKGYDYASPGAYFVTICVQDRECVLGDVLNGEMTLSDAGHTVQACWDDLPNHYSHVQLDAFIVMPNHVHGVIVLVDDTAVVGAGLIPAPTTESPPKRHGLPEIVNARYRRCTILAAGVLRTHRAQRPAIRCYSTIHHRQPPKMGMGPGQSRKRSR